MRKKRVVIIHGYQSNPNRNWFVWLKNNLEEKGIEVLIPELPEPNHPVRNEWVKTIKEKVGEIDQDTFLVAHSLGCITTLYYLSEQKKSIGGLILVAGFSEKIPTIPELEDFCSHNIDFDNIVSIVPKVVFGSPQDYIVPFDLTEKMAKQLDAKLVIVEEAGHFMQEDGFLTFPALLLELESMLDS